MEDPPPPTKLVLVKNASLGMVASLIIDRKYKQTGSDVTAADKASVTRACFRPNDLLRVWSLLLSSQ